MNVLKRLIIPKIEMTIRYILSELEELEREDTFRLKRVKEKKMQKVKVDGAGEQTEVTDAIEPKKEKEEASKHVAEKPVEEAKALTDDKESPTVIEPKEAAEMGDLIVIKPPDDRMDLGDSFIAPPGMKTMATITEIEELLGGISDFDEKEKNKGSEDLPVDKMIEAVEDDQKNLGGNLETGEWFEAPSKIANIAKLSEIVSEHNKIDKSDEELNRKSNDTSAIKLPLKADESVIDLEKRALASLYKGIDSNFYQPTLDDIFSKHDVAMKDSLSQQDVSMIDYSLLDLESIDFSIDSKGKVVLSKQYGTEQSSPALSTYREADVAKQIARYDENGMLIGPASRLPSVRWLGDSLTGLESQTENIVDREHIELKPETVDEKLTIESIDEVAENSIKDENRYKAREENTNDDEKSLDKSNYSLESNYVTAKNSYHDNLSNKSKTSLKETEIWTSNTEKIPKTIISDELQTEQITEDKTIKSVGLKISRSVSVDILSRISEEENIEKDSLKPSSLVEKSNEIQINGKTTEPEVFRTTGQQNRQSKLKIHEQEYFKTINSARSSRDLKRNIDQNKLSKQSAAEVDKSQVTSNPAETERLNLKRESEENIVNNFDTHVKQSVVELERNLSYGQENGSSLRENMLTNDNSKNANNTNEADRLQINLIEKQSEDLIRSEKETSLRDSDDETKTLIIKDVSLEAEGTKNSKTMEQSTRNSQDKHHNDERNSVDKNKIEKRGMDIKDSENDKSEKILNDDNKPFRIRDSNEIINVRNSKTDQSKSSIAEDTNGQAKRESEDKKMETEHKNTSSGVNEPLKIQNSDDVNKTGQDGKRKDRNSQSKEETKKEDTEHKNTSLEKNKPLKIQISDELSKTDQDDKASRDNQSKEETKKEETHHKNTSLEENKPLTIQNSDEINKSDQDGKRKGRNSQGKEDTKKEETEHKSRSLEENRQLKIQNSDEVNKTDQDDEISREGKGREETRKEEREHTKKSVEENKPLKIQNSDEPSKTDQDGKRISRDSQSKEETTKEDTEKEGNERSDSERSTSGINKTRTRHSGDDHLKQD